MPFLLGGCMRDDLLIKLILIWLFVCGLSDFDGQLATLVTLVTAICFYGNSKWKSRRPPIDLSDERKEKIEQIMKSPSPLEVTDYEEKIRRNLILSSAAAIVFTSLGLKLSSSSRFLGGIQFENITSELVYWILLSVIIYESVQYFWLIINSFQLWRVRLTGTRAEEYRGSAGMFGDANDPMDSSGKQENSNFYVWMLENQRKFLNSTSHNTQQWKLIEKAVQELEEKPNSGTEGALVKNFEKLKTAIENQKEAIDNIRIDASMHRFDTWYDSMVKSQSRRWLALDVLLPALLSLTAISLIGIELYRMESVTEAIAEKPLTAYTCVVELTK